MAIALTSFEAMSGFRSLAEIQLHLDLYPEVRRPEVFGATRARGGALRVGIVPLA